VTQEDIKNLKLKNTLNPDFWSKDEEKLNPEIRQHLIMVAEDFFSDLDIPWATLEDVRMTGSLANYNWSKYSDIDLHLLVDYSLVDENHDFAKSYFDARKKLWNEMHDIKIKGFEIEVYVEDTKNSPISSGVYSVLNDEWIKKPVHDSDLNDIDEKFVTDKVKFIIDIINDNVIKNMHEKNYEKVVTEAEKVSEKIKKMRQRGLEVGGEFDPNNLVFKILRRKNILDKLHMLKLDAYDKLMSLS